MRRRAHKQITEREIEGVTAMEYLKVASEGRASPKREFRASKAQLQRSKKSSILEAIIKQARSNNSGGGIVSATKEEGVVRVKILVKKDDLKQMLDVVARGGGGGAAAAQSLEQRLSVMRRRQELRAVQAKASCRSSWCPVLQSIPEEF